MSPATPDPHAPREWWSRSWLLVLLALLPALPLLWPAIPPLVDLPGHMGRYSLQLDLDRSPFLQGFFRFEWALIGNLGVDLLVVPLSKLLGLELAVKTIALAIPAMTAAGFLLVAREAHGRVPPTALFALPLAYNHPLIYGFANFALSAALAFLAFALWLRLARKGRTALRAALFVPISLALWITHTFGWGILGLLAYAAEWTRAREAGRGIVKAMAQATANCLPLAGPLLLMLAWRSGAVAGQTGDWLNLGNKVLYLTRALRDRWVIPDLAAVSVVVLLILLSLRSGKLAYSPVLRAAAVVLGLVYLLLPRVLFGSNFADMRLAPYFLAVAALAIGAPADTRLARKLALAGLAFILARTAITTASAFAYDRSYTRELAALDRLPRGTRVAAFVGKPCDERWQMTRLDHLPALAIVRRAAFANDQWAMAGAQLLRVRHADAPGFDTDPSQIVLPPGCRHPEWRTLDDALRDVPRGAFDHIWLIAPPPYDATLVRGLTPVWRDGTSVLFRIDGQNRE